MVALDFLNKGVLMRSFTGQMLFLVPKSENSPCFTFSARTMDTKRNAGAPFGI